MSKVESSVNLLQTNERSQVFDNILSSAGILGRDILGSLDSLFQTYRHEVYPILAELFVRPSDQAIILTRQKLENILKQRSIPVINPQNQFDAEFFSAHLNAISVCESALKSFTQQLIFSNINFQTPEEAISVLRPAVFSIKALASLHIKQFLVISRLKDPEDVDFNWKIENNKLTLDLDLTQILTPSDLRPQEKLRIGCPATPFVDSLFEHLLKFYTEKFLKPNWQAIQTHKAKK